MNDPVLATIGADLQRAVRRRVARRRRRRLATALALCAAALVAVTGALAGGVDPLALLPDIRGMAPPAHDVRRVDLTVEGRAGEWHVVAYRSGEGAFCKTAALGGRRPEGVGCAAGFVLADGALDGELPSLGFFGGARTRRLVTGAVTGDVDRVTIEDGTGRRYPAPLSDATIAIRVRIPREGLTPLGRRRAARMPRRLVLRVFAAELPRHTHSGHWTRRQVLAAPVLRFHLHWRDGRTTVASGPPASG